MRVDFEWDLNGIWRGGIYEAARYGFRWDFEGGHIIIRFGFEWDLSGILRGYILCGALWIF